MKGNRRRRNKNKILLYIPAQSDLIQSYNNKGRNPVLAFLLSTAESLNSANCALTA